MHGIAGGPLQNPWNDGAEPSVEGRDATEVIPCVIPCAQQTYPLSYSVSYPPWGG